jgi:nucleoid DNA-binding protein
MTRTMGGDGQLFVKSGLSPFYIFFLDIVNFCWYYTCNYRQTILQKHLQEPIKESHMTKKDIILKVSDDTNLKQIDVKKVVQKTFDFIIEALVRGEKIELRNFGVFKIKQRRSRTGRNPRTGQIVPVPPRKVVVFKPGLEMKQKIR